MAKTVYKIPTSIARSWLDHEISLSKSMAIAPISMKVIAFWVLSVLAMFWALSTTFLRNADLWILILIGVLWLIATAFLGRYSKTKQLNIERVPALLDYIQPSMRKVTTRRSDDPSKFYAIAGVEGIDDEGFITWTDGTVGKAFLVVGSASVLVFEQDKLAILDRVDDFYRKIDTSSELIWLTTKEPQRVYRQLANLELRNRRLQVEDPELRELMEEQYTILTNHVGGAYTSIHQYLVIKADNFESLRRSIAIVEAEVVDSALMIKQLAHLDHNETLSLFRTVYVGPR